MPQSKGNQFRQKNIFLLLIISGLVFVFCVLAANILSGEPFRWDGSLMRGLHQFSRPWLDQVMLGITYTGSELTVITFAGLLYWLYRSQEMKFFWGAVISFLGAISLNGLIKLFFARPRPSEFPPLSPAHTYGFPSGHTVAAISLYGFLAYAFWQNGKKGWAALAAGWIFLIAISRIYLGMHYPSDVIGGLVFGGIWLLGVIYAITTTIKYETS